MRIDKWLWAARFYKTRRLATEAVQKGRILLNGARPKPARDVAVGDALIVYKEEGCYEVQVLVLLEMRGPAKIAQTMYKETEESINNREEQRVLRKLMVSPKPDKAPDKNERRSLRKLHQKQ